MGIFYFAIVILGIIGTIHLLKQKTNTINDLNIMPEKLYNNLNEQINRYLKKENIKYWVSEDKRIFRIGFEMDINEHYEMFIKLPEHCRYIEFSCDILIDIADVKVPLANEIIARINQFYNFGHVNFYFENRLIAFSNTMILFENELTENKFNIFFDQTLEGARKCRPLVKKVILEGEEPIIVIINLSDPA